MFMDPGSSNRENRGIIIRSFAVAGQEGRPKIGYEHFHIRWMSCGPNSTEFRGQMPQMESLPFITNTLPRRTDNPLLKYLELAATAPVMYSRVIC